MVAIMGMRICFIYLIEPSSILEFYVQITIIICKRLESSSDDILEEIFSFHRKKRDGIPV